MAASGNNFATPLFTGLVTRILAEHPGPTVFHLKTALYALPANASIETHR